jgi:tetratricopeptide (TPR) repeat protein
MSAESPHRAHEYLEGLLTPEEETAFLAHMAGCAECLRALDEDAALGALEARARAAPAPAPARRPLLRRLRRSGRSTVLLVASAAAAAAALALVLPRLDRRGPTTPPAPVQLALAPERAIEPRLTWADADRYRPYAVARGGPGGADLASPEMLAALSARGDRHGLAALSLLGGDRARARAYLDQAGRSPDLDSDRAALALLEGDAEAAVELTEAVLRARPDHPQALWNRGLALARLGLPLSAAEAFARVAELDPAWAAEARQRADALVGAVDEQRRAWASANDAGYAMVAGGPVLDLAVARRFPGLARLHFYNALRVAPDRARVAQLAPLARELDKVSGGDVLARAVERAATRPFAARATLLPAYQALVEAERAGTPLPREEMDRWFARARAARADDLVLGALVLDRRLPERIDEHTRLALATGDPWFALLADRALAMAAAQRGDYAGAEAIYRRALATCEVTPIPWRCGEIPALAAFHLLSLHRFREARPLVRQALERARRVGDKRSEVLGLNVLGELEYLHDRFALARAYLGESALADASPCRNQRFVRLLRAQMLIFERRPDEAREELRATLACGPETSLEAITIDVDLHRYGLGASDEPTLRGTLQAWREQHQDDAVGLQVATLAEARLDIDRDPGGGRRRLEALLVALGDAGDMATVKVRNLARATLAVDAGRRGDWDALARDLGDDAPAPCRLSIVLDDERLAMAAADPTGRVHGHYDGHVRHTDAARMVPDAVRQALAACPTVRVRTLPPLVGAPDLLPDDMAWSYLVSRGAGRAADAVPARRVVVADAQPPAELGLAPLLPLPAADDDQGAVLLRGAEATPARVRVELAGASLVEIHVHGMDDLARSDVPLLALSPGDDGEWALTAESVRKLVLARAPVVLLADCHAGRLARHEAWGLPIAFVDAGARAVFASPDLVADADASAFFALVRERLAAGDAPAAALRAARAPFLARDPQSWVRTVMVFE